MKFLKKIKNEIEDDISYESDIVDFSNLDFDDKDDIYTTHVSNNDLENNSLNAETTQANVLLDNIRNDDNLTNNEKIIAIKELSDNNQQVDEFLTEYEKDKIAKLELEDINLDDFKEEVDPPHTKFLILGLLLFLLMGVAMELGLFSITEQRKSVNGSDFVIKKNHKDIQDDAQSYVDINNVLNNYENEIFEDLIEHNNKGLYNIYNHLFEDYEVYKDGRFDLYNDNKTESENLDKVLTFKFVRNLDFLSYYLFKTKSDTFNDYRNEIYVSKQESKSALEKYLQKHNIQYNVNDDKIVLY